MRKMRPYSNILYSQVPSRKRKLNYYKLIRSALVFALMVSSIFLLLYFYQDKAQQNVFAQNTYTTTDTIQNARPKIEKQKAEGYLVLVNWDNPIQDERRPQGLERLDTIFTDNGVILSSPEACIERETGYMLKRMLSDAPSANGRYNIVSTYRSIAHQSTFWQERKRKDPSYGQNPYQNPVKVMPGNKSEHSTGLAIDILSENYSKADDGYGQTNEGKWLANNAHNYGFILRYPKDKEHITGVIYEPWHFRYVGKEHATNMYKSGLCLEEYVK